MTSVARKILIGVACAGLLLFLLVAGLLLVRTPMRTAKTQAVLFMYSMASSNYVAVYHRWPQSVADINTNAASINWAVQGLPPSDAWGRSIIYEAFDPARGYGRALSYGRDGKSGGEGADADIESRFGK